jgi:hypothetical protein
MGKGRAGREVRLSGRTLFVSGGLRRELAARAKAAGVTLAEFVELTLAELLAA